MNDRKTVAEFFAGIGLMRMGLEADGWSVDFANDIAPDKHEMYSAHFRDAEDHFLLGDIHELEASQIPSISLATASFPCNDLSLAGGAFRVGREKLIRVLGVCPFTQEHEGATAADGFN